MNQPSDHAAVRVTPPVVLLANIVLGFVLKALFPARIAPRRWPRSATVALGLPLLLAGLAVSSAAVRRMRRSGTSPSPFEPSTALVTSGPYRFTRNPIYLGFTLVILGIGLLANSLWFIPLAAALVVTIQTQVIRYEEAYLEGKFGAQYRAYKEQVRRWLGRRRDR